MCVGGVMDSASILTREDFEGNYMVGEGVGYMLYDAE